MTGPEGIPVEGALPDEGAAAAVPTAVKEVTQAEPAGAPAAGDDAIAATPTYPPSPLGARVLILLAILMWVVVRHPILDQFVMTLQTRPAQAIQADLPLYMAMAEATLHHGRLGWYDAARVLDLKRLSDVKLDVRTIPPRGVSSWKFFDYNDWGYSLVVAAAWLVSFHQRGVLSLVMFQYLTDFICLALVFWMGSRLSSPWAGAACALIWAIHPTLASLVNQPYYYYWNVVVVVLLLALWVRRYGDAVAASGPGHDRRALWSMFTVGLVLGLGTLLRATAEVLVPTFLLFLFVRERISRRTLIQAGVLLFGFVLPLLPVARAKYEVFGRLQLTGKEIRWHAFLLGLGAWDNPWGLKYQDEVVAARIKAKYATGFYLNDMYPYDQACKREVLALWHENPGIFVRNFFRNVRVGLSFHSMIPIDQDMPSVSRALNHVRLLMWLGMAVMLGLSWRAAPQWRYWLFVLAILFVLPILTTAPILPPNYFYCGGLLGPEVLLAGIGIGELGRIAGVCLGRRRGQRPA